MMALADIIARAISATCLVRRCVYRLTTARTATVDVVKFVRTLGLVLTIARAMLAIINLHWRHHQLALLSTTASQIMEVASKYAL